MAVCVYAARMHWILPQQYKAELMLLSFTSRYQLI